MVAVCRSPPARRSSSRLLGKGKRKEVVVGAFNYMQIFVVGICLLAVPVGRRSEGVAAKIGGSRGATREHATGGREGGEKIQR